MQTKQPGMVVAAQLSEEERAEFNEISTAIESAEQAAQSIVRAAMASLAKRREELNTRNRAAWEAIEKKYGLDPRKSYELVRSTGELVEHQCSGAFTIVNLGPNEDAPDPSKAN